MADDLKSAVALYFSLGLNHKETLHCLAHINGIIISIRTLRRIFKKESLFRRKEYSNILYISLFVIEELHTSSRLHGYRFVHLACIREGFVVKQETMRLLLQILDPEGVDFRRRRRLRRRTYYNKGPNFMWHLDSYDKLKPYGICINGAIDGYSRYVLWLRAFRTNSDPRIIGNYFTELRKEKEGCPVRIRADFGTENEHVRHIQEALRFDHHDSFSRRSFIYGSSNHNQRIESWWAFLRNHQSQYWMKIFHDLKEDDLFVGDFLEKNLIQFVFMNIIQGELDSVARLWNSHRIRPTRNQIAPHGKPVMMYYLPHLLGAEDYLCRVSTDKIRLSDPYCLPAGPYQCDRTVFDLCCLIMDEQGLSPPRNPEDGMRLYMILRTDILANL